MTVTEEIMHLRRDVRYLARSMVRLEMLERSARETNHWQRAHECHEQRALVQERRSALLREVWDAERGER